MKNDFTVEAAVINRIVKRRAYTRVRYALKVGLLVKPDKCERCGKKRKLESHHEDYLYPLDVEWVCRKCQAGIHAEKAQELRKVVDRLLPPPRRSRDAVGRFAMHPDREIIRRRLGRHTAPSNKGEKAVT